MEEIDMARLREVTGKAVSGSLLLLIKWFKRSRKINPSIPYWNIQDLANYSDIFKFEYLTQLLLDSNYLPLILKMFAHQDVDQAVDQLNDHKELR